jgi:hypothetical protein
VLGHRTEAWPASGEGIQPTTGRSGQGEAMAGPKGAELEGGGGREESRR